MMKLIKTTVNMDYSTFMKLRSVAEENDVSTNELVDILVILLRKEPPLALKAFRQVKYQERISERVWKKFHISFKHARYETCIDLRKLYKYSVSGLLSMAIDLFLERAVELLKNSWRDNYCDYYEFFVKNPLSPTFYMINYTLPSKKHLNFILPGQKSTA